MDENGVERVITFPEGIPGFEEVKRYILNMEEDALQAWLEAVGNPEIRFFVIHPQLLFQDYLLKVELSSAEMESLDLNSEDAVDVWSIVTIHTEELSKSTINLRAPIIINFKTKKGIQLILNDDKYSSQQPMFAASLKKDGNENSKEGAEG